MTEYAKGGYVSGKGPIPKLDLGPEPHHMEALAKLEYRKMIERVNPSKIVIPIRMPEEK